MNVETIRRKLRVQVRGRASAFHDLSTGIPRGVVSSGMGKDVIIGASADTTRNSSAGKKACMSRNDERKIRLLQ